MLSHLGDDDRPVGRVLTRREALLALGAGANALLVAGCGGNRELTAGAGPGTTCTARPELTEGPYYVDTRLNRSEIVTDAASGAARAGIPLVLAFNVSRINANRCTPLANTLVDVWHCDALGLYSGVNDPQFGSTAGQTWLRGYQLTDANGRASFTTIFPGWYPGRAAHIHFTVRSAPAAGASYHFTSQLFFNEGLLAQVYSTRAPYSQKGDAGRIRNESDGVYRQGGAQLLLDPVSAGDGYSAMFDLGLVT
jgi:protocatechuate 3,4-dioxygenase beta subunit